MHSFSTKSEARWIFRTHMAREYSCVHIFDTVCYFYLFSILTSILHAFFLTCTKFTTALITDIHYMDNTVPGLLVHSNIIWFALRTLVIVVIFVAFEFRKKFEWAKITLWWLEHPCHWYFLIVLQSKFLKSNWRKFHVYFFWHSAYLLGAGASIKGQYVLCLLSGHKRIAGRIFLSYLFRGASTILQFMTDS